MLEWNGMECWNGITKQGSQNRARYSRVNRVGKNSESGDQLIKDRGLGDQGDLDGQILKLRIVEQHWIT